MFGLNVFDVAKHKGINVERVNEIKVQPLNPELKSAIKKSNLCLASKCFNNVWNIVYKGVVVNAEFVLVIALDVLPIEHAILYIDGKYYDPTWEMHIGHIGKCYLKIAQFDRDNLVRVAKSASVYKDGVYVPMLDDLRNLSEFNCIFKGLN